MKTKNKNNLLEDFKKIYESIKDNYFLEDELFRFALLEKKHTSRVGTLLKEAFPHCYEEALEDVEKNFSQQKLDDFNLMFVLVDSKKDLSVGTTGVILEEGKIWLNWYTMDVNYRGRGLGEKLLQFAIDLVLQTEEKYFYCVTTDLESQSSAQKLYDAYNFEIYETKPSTETPCMLLYRRLNLEESCDSKGK